jgi:hypothetical protein
MAVAAGLATSMLPALAGAAPTAEQAELAERLLQTGQRLAAVPAGVKVAGAVADVAERLYDNNARLVREDIDIRLALGQRDKAIALLNTYRRLDPGDQIAQVQAIDLQQSKLESANEKADYLARVTASDKVPAEVRSHAATLLANIELERGRDAASAAALNQALGLNPLNPKALRMQADALAAHGTAFQRTAAWVNLLRANGTDFTTASRLGEELLRAGLTQPAQDFYKRFFAAVDAAGYATGADDAINYAHALIVANKTKDAGDVAAEALKDAPGDLSLHELRMLVAKAANDDAAFKAALGEARAQAIRALIVLHTQVDANAPKPDDRTEIKLPDVKVDVAAVQAKGDAQLAQQYLQALGDLAWVDAYFGGRAPDAAVTEAINTLAGQDSPLAHRIAGFVALSADRLDEADVAFSPVAERDVLSRLGVLALKLKKGEDKAAIAAEGNKLLAQLPTDIWPLVIRQSLKDAGPLSFKSPDTDAVAAEYAKLPADVWGFAEGRIPYLVDLLPLTGSVGFGEPILVKVTLQNTSRRPLAIGPGTGLAQQVSIDANLRSVNDHQIPAAAVAKLTARLVVPPNQTTSTVVRLDSPELGAQLAQVPQVGAAIFTSAVTNPQTIQQTTPQGATQQVIVPGPGGYRAQGRATIDRPQVAFTRQEARDKLLADLNGTDSLKRTRAVAALSACAAWMRSTQSEDLKPLFGQAGDMLKQLADKDSSPTVRSLARQELYTLSGEKERPEIVKQMLASADFESRVLGTLLCVQMRKADRDTLLAGVVNDSDEAVKNLATAVANLPDAPPASQPAAAK